MKDFTSKLVGKSGIALIVLSLVIGFIVGTNVIQPDLVAKAAASVVSSQQKYHDQSIGNVHGLTIGFVDQGMLPHPESNSYQSASGNHRMSMSSGNTMPGTDMPGMGTPGADMPGMDMPGMDSGHNQQNSSMGVLFDAKTIVPGGFAAFNGLILIIAAFLKHKHTRTRRKMNQYSCPKESVV